MIWRRRATILGNSLNTLPLTTRYTDDLNDLALEVHLEHLAWAEMWSVMATIFILYSRYILVNEMILWTCLYGSFPGFRVVLFVLAMYLSSWIMLKASTRLQFAQWLFDSYQLSTSLFILHGIDCPSCSNRASILIAHLPEMLQTISYLSFRAMILFVKIFVRSTSTPHFRMFSPCPWRISESHHTRTILSPSNSPFSRIVSLEAAMIVCFLGL